MNLRRWNGKLIRSSIYRGFPVGWLETMLSRQLLSVLVLLAAPRPKVSPEGLYLDTKLCPSLSFFCFFKTEHVGDSWSGVHQDGCCLRDEPICYFSCVAKVASRISDAAEEFRPARSRTTPSSSWYFSAVYYFEASAHRHNESA